MKSLSQDKLTKISYLSSEKWDKLGKSGIVFPQPCSWITITMALPFALLKLMPYGSYIFTFDKAHTTQYR